MVRPPIASWLASFLYVTVLAAGLWGEAAGLCPASPMRTAGFVAAIALLLALEPAERRRYGDRTPRGPAITLLALRAGLFVVVTALDCSGTARSLFLLIPFIAYFTLGRRAGYALAALCLGGVVLALSTRPGWYSDEEGLSDLLMFCIGLVFAIAMAAVAHREADQVAELATAAERDRLARDIHDNVGHHLTVISVQLEKAAAFRDLDASAADQALADARQSARLALEEVRRSVGTLRAHGEVFSLSTALTRLVERLGDGGPTVALEVSGDESLLKGAALPALYNAAQEGLTNACRHARADHVTVRVVLGERDARLTVADDGQGLPPGAYDKGFGLRGMRERLELVGGSLSIETPPGGGTLVMATVPGAS